MIASAIIQYLVKVTTNQLLPMIGFFRKIRKRLAVDNKPLKYFRYAIGEIVLVVIGILIALSINNWNEEKKVNIFEKKLLEDLFPFVESNMWQLDMSIKGSERHIKSAEIILTHLENNLPYHDSLDYHFSRAISWNHPTIKNTAYETLKAYGMNTIKNDSLRIKLIIYERGWLEIFNSRQHDYYYSTASPILAELFESVVFWGEMKPNDYEELQKSKKFASVLRTCIANRNAQIKWYSQWLEDFGEIEDMITIELKENQN